MEDIVERIRGLRWLRVPVASELMAEAAAEIERLRLTNSERMAVATAIVYLKEDDDFPGIAEDIATLRNLLERLA